MKAYEVGERLVYTDVILYDSQDNTIEDLPMDAPERQTTVIETDGDHFVYVRFDDGVEDYYPTENMPDYFERVTWDSE